MEYYHKKNEIMSFEATSMELEIIILSEMEPRKMTQMNFFTNRNRLTDIENKLMVIKGERLGGGINWEFGIDIYSVLYIK